MYAEHVPLTGHVRLHSDVSLETFLLVSNLTMATVQSLMLPRERLDNVAYADKQQYPVDVNLGRTYRGYSPRWPLSSPDPVMEPAERDKIAKRAAVIRRQRRVFIKSRLQRVITNQF